MNLRMKLTTLLGVLLASMAMNSAFAGDGCCKQKDGKGACPKGRGIKTCRDYGPDACKMECGTKEIEKKCFKAECTTVCLPTRPCLRDPACKKGGCDDKEKSGDKCSQKDGCGKCGGGLFGGLFSCNDCRARVKKHLYVKEVTVGKIPVRKCVADGKGEDKAKDAKGEKVEAADGDDVPPPPAVEARALFGKPIVERTVSYVK